MTELTERFRNALDFAHDLHLEQKRKGTEIPYLSHLLGVASIVLENGASEDTAIAALLHDAVEDQGGEPVLREIRRRFGDGVAQIVDDCTDATVIPKPPWRPRKEEYLAHLSEVSPASRLVSVADKLHNVRAILADYRVVGEAVWERFKGGKEGTLWYYRALVERFMDLGPRDLADELARAVQELESAVADSNGG